MTETPFEREPAKPPGDAEWEAVARYLSGESATDEARTLEVELRARPADAELFAQLDRMTGRLAAKPVADLDVESKLRETRVLLGAAPLEPHVSSQLFRPARRVEPRAQRRWRVPVPAIAAVLLIGIGIALWQSRRDAPAADARSLTTGVGQRDSLMLDDGSRAILGPSSALVVAAGYGDSHRTVELRGEGFFIAVHDESRPFVVRAGGATIRDLGTAFSVKQHAGDSVVVTVTEGAVVLHATSRAETDGVALGAGDVGVLAGDARPVARTGGATEESTAWTRGQLVFREALLAQVAMELRRWYGLELRLADTSLAQRRFSATFAGETAEQVLDALRIALGVDIVRRGDTAIVRSVPGRGTR